ncbi:hypothetical protein [Bacterioplanoides sp. SCSIO 12839]|uniref:hypothetical protein n=1 Tax=Bacterioplanoides sp. SCSIO 12839 TaxID=2829569 RepID=UPI00210314B0|nr:hypothetical protein [Bacterioplanoides sp. SCSIO 12839]UTW49281.1 hypothetical protein KFF03_05090 [Bacterioplanoides sp. SCSIO 12839]
MNFEAHYEREGTTGWPIKSWEDANKLLSYQKAEGPSFTVFTIKNGSYVQCAGGKKRLVVEARVFESSGGYKHYRFGKGQSVGDDEVVECNCGPITTDASQVLTMKDARLIIRHFVENNGEIISKYYANDITHNFA